MTWTPSLATSSAIAVMCVAVAVVPTWQEREPGTERAKMGCGGRRPR
jgi:hypothetical protein